MAMPAAVCLFAFFILPVSIFVTFTRLPPFVALLSTVALVATALAPHQLRFAAGEVTYSALYDRWGYCLFLIPLITMAVPPPDTAGWKDVVDGLIAGSFVVLTIFLKISYGLLLLAAFVGFAVVVLRSPAYYIAAIVAAILLVAIFGWMIKWDFTAFIHDMKVFAHARKGLGLGGCVHSLLFLLPDVCLFLLLGILACAAELLLTDKASIGALLRISSITLAYAFCAVAIVMSNTQEGTLRDSPVLCIGSLIILSEIIRRRGRGGQAPETGFLRTDAPIWISFVPGLLSLLGMGGRILFYRGTIYQINQDVVSLIALLLVPLCLTSVVERRFSGRRPVILAVCGYILVLILAGSITARNIEGLIIAFRNAEDGRKLSADQIFQSGSLKGLQIRAYGGDPPLPTNYIGKVQDGLDLINRTGSSEKSVASWDFSNPFNVTRGVKPAAGSPLGWQLEILFSAASAPDVQQIFKGAEVVMVPKEFGSGHPETLVVLDQLYGAYLHAHYTLAGESRQWFLYRQK